LVFQRGGVRFLSVWVLCLSLCPPRMSIRRPVSSR
jgi:hypothetical protein